MLREQASRLSIALKRALNSFEAGDDDPIVAMKTAVEHAVREDEDVLTALIFERLRYLPDALAWTIVVDAATVLRGEPPPFVGTLADEVWPRISHPASGTYVEPDVNTDYVKVAVRLYLLARHLLPLGFIGRPFKRRVLLWYRTHGGQRVRQEAVRRSRA